MSIPINLASLVLNTLFNTHFDLVRSAVLVVSSPGYLMRLPPAVKRTRLGSFFLWMEVYDKSRIGECSALSCYFFDLFVGHDEDEVGAFFLHFVVALGHASPLFSKPSLPYVSGGWVVGKSFVGRDSFAGDGMYHRCAEMFHINVEIVVHLQRAGR